MLFSAYHSQHEASYLFQEHKIIKYYKSDSFWWNEKDELVKILK